MIIRSIYRQYGFLRRFTRRFICSSSARSILLSAALCLLLITFGMFVRNRNCVRSPVLVTSVTVSRGDTVWSIAREYGDPNEYILTCVTEITRMNELGRDYVLREGQVLIVPVRNGDARALIGGRYAKREASN